MVARFWIPGNPFFRGSMMAGLWEQVKALENKYDELNQHVTA
jgi:hypothetical protein